MSPRRIRDELSRRAIGGCAEGFQGRSIPGHRAVSNEDRDSHSFTLDVNVARFYLDRICDFIDARLHEDFPSRRRERVDRRLQQREVALGRVLAYDERGLVPVYGT